MSPEMIALLLGGLGILLKLFDNEVKNKARHDKLEADALAEKTAKIKRDDLADSKRENIINTFVLEFKSEIAEQKRLITSQSKEITDVKVENGNLKGKLSVLMSNQESDRAKLAKYDKRITELENDNKFKAGLISDLKTERDNLKQKYEDARDRILALTIELNQVKEEKGDLEYSLMNGADKLKTAEIRVVADSQVETHISNVQTAKIADSKQTKDKE